MKVTRGFAVLLLVLLARSASQGQEIITHNGYWWVDQPESFKLGFATGYAIAMTNTSELTVSRCIAAKNGGTMPEHVLGSEAMTACLQTPEYLAETFSNVHIGQLVDGVDEFYKDFRNKYIKIEFAMYYVRDELKGKTDRELADELAGWRQAANK